MRTDTDKHIIKVFNLDSKTTGEYELSTSKALHAENRNIVWNIKFYFYDEILEIVNEYLLSEAINKIREVIEPKGFRLLIKCCEFDAAHSGMQADMSAGTKIYKLSEFKFDGENIDYDVLAPSNINSVVTLEEQRKNKRDYLTKIKERHKNVL